MFIGIDLGTSELKVLLLNDQHQVLAVVGEALSVQQPQALWREQPPADWWAATDRALLRLRASHPQALSQVQAIGLSGQMHGAVLLDEADRVLRNAILWNDGRSGPQCAELEAACPTLRQISGNLAMPGFTAPKLRWVAQHEPALFERTRCVLLPKDWLRLQMTGEKVSDMSDASGTLWLDVAARDWSDTLLAATGLTRAHMPRLVEGSAPSGSLLPALAQRWGLPASVLVAGGGGDNAASAVGMGAVRPGQGFVSLGTSGVIFLCGERFAPNPEQAVHAFCHALPHTWHQMSVMLSAASSLRWARTLMGLSSEAELMAQVAALPAHELREAPLFLPYLNGERTPHNNPQAQGVLFGLNSGHTPAHIGFAVVEGVSLGLLEGWRALGDATATVHALSLVGGGARSAWWAQWLASTLNVTLHTHEAGDAGGALGAARLGWLARGAALSDVATRPAVVQAFEPDPAQQALIAPRQERWQRLYPALRGEFA